MTDSSELHSDGVSPITDLVTELRKRVDGITDPSRQERMMIRSIDRIEALEAELADWKRKCGEETRAWADQMIRADKAEQERDALETQTKNWMRAIDKLTSDRDEWRGQADAYAAVIAEALVAHQPDWSDWDIDHPEEGASCTCGYNGAYPCPTRRILSAVPSDVLREHDERVWDEGFHAAIRSDIQPVNPYRRIEGSSDAHE